MVVIGLIFALIVGGDYVDRTNTNRTI